MKEVFITSNFDFVGSPHGCVKNDVNGFLPFRDHSNHFRNDRTFASKMEKGQILKYRGRNSESA